MARLPEFSPQLDERLTAEFLAHTLELLPFPLQQDDAMLDASALRFERPELARDPDLPLLAPKTYPRPEATLVEETVRSLVPPPASEPFVGRRAELDQAVLSLIANRPVVLSGENGTGKTTLLRHIAHDPRIRAHFKRIYWLDDLAQAGITLGLALNAPSVLRAEPDEQPRVAREFLAMTTTLLLIDNADADAVDWALKLMAPVVLATESTAKLPTSVTPVALAGLPAEVGTELLATLSGQTATTVQALAKMVDYHPGSLHLIAGLLIHDDLTPATAEDILEHVSGDRQAALYAASFEALPASYQAFCRALAASPRRWIAVSTVTAAFGKPLVAQRTLQFVAKRRFIERLGDAIRVVGNWSENLPAADGPTETTVFTAIERPAERFKVQTGTQEQIEQSLRLHAQGIAWMEEGKDDEAEAALTQALVMRQSFDTDHAVAETLVALGRLAYLRGDDATAIRRLEAAAERIHTLRDNESLEVIRIALSRVYRRAGRLDAALSVLGDEAPLDDLVAVYLARQDWDALIALYERTADKKPTWASLGLGEVYLLAGRYADALAAVAESNTFEAHWLRGMVYHAQGDTAKAQDIYMRIRIDVPPKLRAPFARVYAKALASAGETHDAAMVVGAEGVWYEAKMPRPAFARQRISQALFAHLSLMLGKPEEAEAAALKALRLPGERPDSEATAIAYRVLARLSWNQGELERTQSYFEEELKARSTGQYRDEHEIGLTLHNIADVMRQRGQLDRAVANYRRALTHKSVEKDAHSVLLTRLALRDLLSQIRRDADAIEVGEEAVALVTRHPEADLRELGYVLALHSQSLNRAGKQNKGTQVFQQWLNHLAHRADEGINHSYWGVQVLTIGLYVRRLSTTSGSDIDEPITLVDLAEQAAEAAEAYMPRTWIAWAARRDLGNIYLRLERWADAYEVFGPLLTGEQAVPGNEAPFVSLAAQLGSARAAARLDWRDDAMEHYNAARAFEPDKHARGLIMLEAADMYRKANDDAHAAERYIAALELLDRQKSPPTYVDTVVNLAYARLRMQRFGDAIETFEAAIAFVEKLPKPDDALMASALYDMANAHFTLGHYHAAAATFKRALSYQDMRRDPERYVETLMAMARSNVADEAYQPALESFHEVLLFEGLPADMRRGLLSEQAEVYVKVHLTQAAIDAYRAALGIEGGTAVERAAIHRGLGKLYTNQNAHDRARTHFEAALSAVQDEQSGLTLQALAEGHRAQGQLQDAIHTYELAISQLSRATYPRELAEMEGALGEIYLSYGEANLALEHLEAALEIERMLPHQHGGRIVHTLQGVAQANELRGELELAIRRHHEALVYQDVRHAPNDYVATLCTLGRLYAQLGRDREAAKAYEEALATENRQAAPNPERIDEITEALADVYRAQGKLEAAAKLYRSVAQTPPPSPEVTQLHKRAVGSLESTEADIARHLKTLHAAEQSWILLNRVPKPDLKGLVFVRALQAQTCANLGRPAESDQFLDQLMQLLRRRRSELQDDARPVMRAMAMLVKGQDFADAENVDGALDAYEQALALAQQDDKSEPALLWAIQRKAVRVIGN